MQLKWQRSRDFERKRTRPGTTTIDESWIWWSAAVAGLILLLLIIPWERWSKPSQKTEPPNMPGAVIVIPCIAAEEDFREERPPPGATRPRQANSAHGTRECPHVNSSDQTNPEPCVQTVRLIRWRRRMPRDDV